MNVQGYKVVEKMSRLGGGFVRALSVCFTLADDNNFRKLKETFSEYWEKYKDM